MNENSKIDFDVVIVGGGLVGSALACALGNSGFSVMVAEAGEAQAQIGSDYDIRVSAITGASRNFFRSVDAWQGMERRRMGQVREMQVWDQGGTGSLHLDAAETGEACLAYIIENSVIRAALYERLQALNNVRYYENTAVTLDQFDDEMVRLGVSGKPVTTRLVVGADGARSMVRQWAEIPVSGWSFNQTAIVATVQHESPHGYTAWQRFLETGPLAFLPLDDEHRSSIVWSADTARAQELQELSDEAFAEQLADSFEHRLGALQLVSKRGAFPLSLMQADRTVGHRIVLVGDAAHRVHPLAGQGLNLGIADVAALAEVLLAKSSPVDAGSNRILREYERWRAGDTLMMVRLMDAFKRAYGSPIPAIKGLRNFGMDLMSANGLMRQVIMAFASGAGGDKPARLNASGN